MKLRLSHFSIFWFAILFVQVITAQTKDEFNILFLKAAENDQADSVKYWLGKGADVNYADNGNTAIDWAIAHNNREILKYLILNNININSIDTQGLTPIMKAAETGDVHACKILFDSGADISIKNQNGEDVIQHALKKGFKRVADFFIDQNTYRIDSTYSDYQYLMTKYAKKNDSESAIKNGLKALDRAKSELIPNHKDFLVIQEYLFSICFFFGKYEEAENHLIELLAVEEKEDDKTSYAIDLLCLSNLLKIQNKDSQADTIMNKAIDLLKDDNDNPIEWRIQWFNLLVSIYSDMKEYFNIERVLLNRLLLIKGLKGIGNSYYIEGLIGLADFYMGVQKTVKEKAVLTELVKIKELYSEIEIPEFQSKLNRLKNLNQVNGHFKDIPLLSKSDSTLIINQEIETESYLWNEYHGLSEGYFQNNNNIGQFIKNRLKWIKGFTGENSTEYAEQLFKLGNWYIEMGQYDNAQESYLQALKIIETVLGINHAEYLKILKALGRLYAGSNHSELAENIFYRSLEIIKLNYGERSENFGFALCDLAALYHKQGKLNESLEIYDKATEILAPILNKRNIRNAEILTSIANLFIELGIHEAAAEDVLKINLQDYKDSLSSKEKRRLHESLLMLYDAKGNFSEIEPHLLEARRITFEFAENAKLNCSMAELADYWETIYNNFNFYKSLIFSHYYYFPHFTSYFAEIEFFTKGFLLTNSQEIQRTILNSGDTLLIHTMIRINDIQKRLLYMESQPNVDHSNLLALEERANRLDKILTLNSQVYRQGRSELQIKWLDVQSKLKEGEAAIEFSSFRFFNNEWTDSTIYCALVLKQGMEYPIIVTLCEQKQLDSLFVGGNAVPNLLYASRGTTSSYNNRIPNFKKLYQLIWHPLEKELLDVKTIYYSPSGSLHKISFAALSSDTSNYLCDRYNLVQLSSTRQLATAAWQTKPGQISSTVLFGGIKYDLKDEEIAELQRSLPKNETNVSRGFTPDSTRSSKTLDSLKWTLDEVESISSMLQARQIKTCLYTGIQGTEEAFKSLSNRNTSVLHIATHGYFYPDIQHKPERFDGLMSLGEQRFRHAPNPLMRSGLILAGGNRTWKGEEPVPGMEDGILTAQEISEMNLLNTDLVVLSACETALGDIKGGEGVFGLQRAFKLAGVKSIIMSLWNVDDKATSEMMQIFYSKWLGGTDKREAFRLSQQELKKKYTYPKYWAGFVMVD